MQRTFIKHHADVEAVVTINGQKMTAILTLTKDETNTQKALSAFRKDAKKAGQKIVKFYKELETREMPDDYFYNHSKPIGAGLVELDENGNEIVPEVAEQ